MKTSYSSNPNNPNHQIVFRVSQQSFCIPVQHVKIIQQIPRIFPVPQAPNYVMGVVNVEGSVIPLIHASTKLNLENAGTGEHPTMIVLEQRSDDKLQQLGIHVDEVMDVIECADSALRALPTSRYQFDERLVDGMFQTGDDFVMKINVQNFFKHNLEELNPALTNNA